MTTLWFVDVNMPDRVNTEKRGPYTDRQTAVNIGISRVRQLYSTNVDVFGDTILANGQIKARVSSYEA